MPIPAKPCEGRFSDEVQVVLGRNIDRVQWANHRCEVCGASVGATQTKGQWVPEQHWPSVKYHPRNGSDKKQVISPENMAPDESAVPADSAAH
jgi:hypothetical protein